MKAVMITENERQEMSRLRRQVSQCEAAVVESKAKLEEATENCDAQLKNLAESYNLRSHRVTVSEDGYYLIEY